MLKLFNIDQIIEKYHMKHKEIVEGNLRIETLKTELEFSQISENETKVKKNITNNFSLGLGNLQLLISEVYDSERES